MVRWCGERNRPVGAIISLSTAWALAQAWYSDRLDPAWRRPNGPEAQAVFTDLGLTDPFWRLAPPASPDSGSADILQTERLHLRRMSLDDAGFILDLLNDASFLRFIGDKGVRTVEDARQYILTGPMNSYERHGFGLWLVELVGSKTPIGMCGFLKRETLRDVDIGFAFLPSYRSKGFAFESAAAVMDYGRNVLGLRRIVAITDEDNLDSIRVLEKIGMSFEQMIRLSEDGPEIRLLVSDLSGGFAPRPP